MTRDNVSPEDRARMDQGSSLIPEHVQGIWVDKNKLFALRQFLTDQKPGLALKLIDELLKIKRPRPKRRHAELWTQFSTTDGALVMRGKLTGINENGYGAQVNFYWQKPDVSTKRSDLEGQAGITWLYCPPGEFYPYPLASTLLRVETATGFKKFNAFVAVRLDQTLTAELLTALESWSSQCAAYQKAGGKGA